MFQAPVAMPRYQRLQRGARSKFGPFVQSISREQKKYYHSCNTNFMVCHYHATFICFRVKMRFPCIWMKFVTDQSHTNQLDVWIWLNLSTMHWSLG